MHSTTCDSLASVVLIFETWDIEAPYLNILLGGSVVKVMLGLQSLPPR